MPPVKPDSLPNTLHVEICMESAIFPAFSWERETWAIMAL